MAKRDPSETQSAVAEVEVALAARAGGTPAGFANLLLGQAPLEDLAACTPAFLAQTSEQAFIHLSAPRPPDTSVITLSDAVCQRREDEHQLTIIDVVNDNMPFLLDSTLAELAEQGFEPHLVAHPILAVARDGAGAFQSLSGAATDRAPQGSRRESLIHIHIDRIDSADAKARLIEGLGKVYSDVRVAVSDWAGMRARLAETVQAYRTNPPPLPEAEVSEALRFLEWIASDNFTLLGVRAYRFAGGDVAADPVEGSGLGILRDPSVRVLRKGRELVVMNPELRAFFARPQALIITKANVKSRVHRRVHLDYVGVKLFTSDGQLDGELRIVGLLTSNAYTGTASSVPYLRLKVESVVKSAGFDANSYSGRALMNVLDAYPRDELFQIDPATLKRFALDILQLTERPRLRVLARIDEFDRFVSVLVFIPKDRYDTSVRRRVGDFLTGVFKGRLSAAYPAYPEGTLARTHYVIGRDEGKTPKIDRQMLEAGVAAIVRTWSDNMRSALDEARASADARALADRYADAFSAAYRENYAAGTALDDIATLQTLSADRTRAVDLYRREGDSDSRANLKVFALGQSVQLSARVPLLENMGFQVIDERTYRIAPKGTAPTARVWLHDMSLERAAGGAIDIEQLQPAIEAALTAQFQGLTESDRFDMLILEAGLVWREAALLRALGRYLRQTGAPYTQDYIAAALTHHSAIARRIVDLFTSRFDPAIDKSARAGLAEGHRAAIEAALADVASLDEDRILRRFVNLIEAMLRTNFFQHDENGRLRQTISFKFESARVEGLPLPRPLYEIFVYSPRVEGVHLRFGKVARGGLRWSDRPQDFRTEVLGLVKAQQVKNAVIVPVGAKGGFFPKQLPPASDRQAWLTEGTEAYKIFVRTLLELTDNLVDGTVVPPAQTMRYDGEDPYLVVAADKGTATFSDTANALSIEKGHWLGDAFASGGSQGYDHKKMGITARGAWEAVKRHFRELDVDIQTQNFTVAGVGDMSGDVFGNGMLLSPAIKLVAAFDHRDIFLDPDPDPRASLAERARIFALPRSSWADYDRNLISAGGGVFPRSAKSIPLAPQVRTLLDLDQPQATPQELIGAILKARVDLLWFGGIGTYIRASDETDAEVGDRANDAIRVTGSAIRARVIGEGANLGATQRGRIEAARSGIRLNTDAIDNSAGVNTSDVEVNIKIALAGPLQDGKLKPEKRNELLAAMTDEVGQLVLRNNYLQSLALSLLQIQPAVELPDLRALMQRLEDEGRLDRTVEFLPSDQVLAERERRGEGLTRPELAVLLAYAKLSLHDELLVSNVPDDAYLARELARYFPKGLRDAYPGEVENHKLRREIVATQLSNAIINRCGPTIIPILAERTQAQAPAIAAAYAIARDSFDLIALNNAIDALDAKLGGAVQLGLYNEVRKLVVGRMNWFLRRDIAGAGGIEAAVARFSAGIAALGADLDRLLPVEAAGRKAAEVAAFVAKGVPADLAARIAALPLLAQATDIVLVSERTGKSVPDAASAFFAVDGEFGVTAFTGAAHGVPALDSYERLARDQAIELIGDAHLGLTIDIIMAGGAEAWTGRRPTEIARLKASLSAILASGLSLPKLMVAAGMLADISGARGSSRV